MSLPEQVRIPSLPVPLRWLVRPEAQSPSGEGCRVSFDRIRYEAGGVTDLRCGG